MRVEDVSSGVRAISNSHQGNDMRRAASILRHAEVHLHSAKGEFRSERNEPSIESRGGQDREHQRDPERAGDPDRSRPRQLCMGPVEPMKPSVVADDCRWEQNPPESVSKACRECDQAVDAQARVPFTAAAASCSPRRRPRSGRYGGWCGTCVCVRSLARACPPRAKRTRRTIRTACRPCGDGCVG